MREHLEIGTARHHLDQLLQSDVGLCVVAEYLAAPQDDEVVPDRISVMRVVRDEDHSDPAAACTM